MGALAARRWFPQSRFLVPFGVLCALLPDIDIFFGNGDPEFNLLHHRGISTSFLGGFILALLAAAFYRVASPRTSFAKTTVLAYGLILTHVWLDLITTYGTQILAPFSTRRFALDGAFIIDPLYTGVALLIICIAFFMKTFGTQTGVAGLSWLAMALVVLGLAAYLYGHWSPPHVKPFTRRRFGFVMPLMIAALGLWMCYDAARQVSMQKSEHLAGGLPWQEWNPGKIKYTLAKKKKVVWIDYTADW